jgi:hypothetical protein
VASPEILVSLRGLLVLIALLAAAIVVLVRVGSRPKESAAAAPDTPLLRSFTEESVRSIDLACEPGPIQIERTSPKGWRLREPVEGDADPRRVHELLAALQDARVRKIASEKATDAAAFGLAPAACTVQLELGTGEQRITLRLGRTSPVGTERYAALEGERVVLTDGSLYTAAARPASVFREKRLIPLAADEMTRIALARPDGRLVLAKVGDAWQVETPRRDVASVIACGSLARALAAVELADAGGVSPPSDPRPGRRLKLDVSAKGSDAPCVGFIAAAGIEGKRLAWKDDPRIVGLVDESAVQEILRPLDSFYETRVVSFSLPDVSGLTISRAGATMQLTRAGEASPWAGSDAGVTFPVDGAPISAFLDRLRGLTAGGFESAAPKTKPAGEIVVSGSRGELARLTYGPLDSGSLWVTTPSRPGTVFRVDPVSLGSVPTRADLAPKPQPAAAASKP